MRLKIPLKPRAGMAWWKCRPGVVWAALAWLISAGETVEGQGAFRVRFEQSVYVVDPNGPFDATVMIDPAPEAGLFSYGLAVRFSSSLAAAVPDGIVVAPALDFNGLRGPAAIRLIEAGRAAVKGTIDLSANPLGAFHGTALATFRLRDLTGQVGESYVLDLDFFRTLGEAETLFVDGEGNPLDAQISFMPATVTVIPEPRITWLAILTLGVPLWRVLRLRQPRGSCDL